jgi:cytochrome b6-f complex iron-sulfur subunit
VNPPEVPEAATAQVEAGATNDPDLLQKGFKIIRFGEDPVIVIRLSPTDIRAFSAVCTHLACIVEYQQKKTRIFCNCHNGIYDLNGRVIAGPPPKPLKKFEVNLVARAGSEAKTIVVSRA